MKQCFQTLKVLVIFIICLITTGLLLSCGTQTQTLTKNIDLSAGQYTSIPVNLKTGDLVEGNFTVQGPTNLDIKFAVQDPSGNNVYGPIQARSQSFTYKAKTDGNHFLFIDNTYSLFNSKAVMISYTCPNR